MRWDHCDTSSISAEILKSMITSALTKFDGNINYIPSRVNYILFFSSLSIKYLGIIILTVKAKIINVIGYCFNF